MKGKIKMTKNKTKLKKFKIWIKRAQHENPFRKSIKVNLTDEKANKEMLRKHYKQRNR